MYVEANRHKRVRLRIKVFVIYTVRDSEEFGANFKKELIQTLSVIGS